MNSLSIENIEPTSFKNSNDLKIASIRKRRVVITGIGVVSPIGIGLSEFWENLLAGKCGVDKITLFDATNYPTQIAAEVKDFQAEKYLSERQIKYYSRGTQFACAAYKMAKEDACIDFVDPDRTDVIMGSSLNGFNVIEEEIIKNPEGIYKFNKEYADPLGMVKAVLNSSATAIALDAQVEGYVTTISTACASGLNAIGNAAERIATGQSDVVICGGVDAPVHRIPLLGFCAARFLSTLNESPKDSLCPFDKRRTKSVFSEGAAVFILEDYDLAVAREAKIYAEIDGFTQGTDNVNELFFENKTGQKWIKSLEKLFKNTNKNNVEYISAHAPSDKFVDKLESKVINQVFPFKPLVSSIKGYVGGNFSPAGAFQVAAGAMTIFTGNIVKNYNYKYPDPECDLNFVTKNILKNKMKSILINGHAVGSVNSALLLKRFKI